MDGLLVVDKPVGPTSHDVVARVRRATGERRIGHTGTLDPACERRAATGPRPRHAAGALPERNGQELHRRRSTRRRRPTPSTQPDNRSANRTVARCRIAAPSNGRSSRFAGRISRQPPIFSAKKIGGVRSHRLARQLFSTGADASPPPSTLLGTTLSLSKGRISSSSARHGRRRLREGELDFQLTSVSVTVSDLRLLDVRGAHVELALTCSAGFYVRTLANDLGRHLGTGAHLAELRRTSSGDLQITDAITLDRIEREPAAVASGFDSAGTHADDDAVDGTDRGGSPQSAAWSDARRHVDRRAVVRCRPGHHPAARSGWRSRRHRRARRGTGAFASRGHTGVTC